MSAMIRTIVILGCLGLALVEPRAASAITVDQVVALARSGVTDTVILALIDRDRSLFAIEPEQIVALQRDGLSEAVILAMLKSGRAEGDQAARADAAYNSAWIASALTTEPVSISVGHGPDRPNTPHIDGFYSGPPASYYGPTFRYRAPSLGSYRATSRGSQRPSEPRALCYAQISTQRTINQQVFVTECPAIMQPRRR